MLEGVIQISSTMAPYNEPIVETQKQADMTMNNALVVDFLGDAVKRAGACKPVMFPNKYRELTMAPQTGLVAMNVEADGKLAGEVSIDLDPFYKNSLLQRRQRLAMRVSETPEAKPAPAAPRQKPATPLFTRQAQRNRRRIAFSAAPPVRQPTNDAAPGNNALAYLPARLAPTAPGSKAQLRVATATTATTATTAPAKNREKLQATEQAMKNIPAQGLRIPARDLRLDPEYLLRMRQQSMRQQKLLAMACA